MDTRLGIYGGTFDPIHIAHLVLAESACAQLNLDRLVFMPCGAPPHKRSRTIVPGNRRLEMVHLAIAGNPNFEASDYEIRLEEINYTVDTLSFLKEMYPQAKLLLILGGDTLADLHQWHEPKQIAEMAQLCFASRPGNPLDFSVVEDLFPPETVESLRQHELQMPLLEISSSNIRHRVATGQSIRYLVPASVEAYIHSHQLYQTPAAKPVGSKP